MSRIRARASTRVSVTNPATGTRTQINPKIRSVRAIASPESAPAVRSALHKHDNFLRAQASSVAEQPTPLAALPQGGISRAYGTLGGGLVCLRDFAQI